LLVRDKRYKKTDYKGHEIRGGGGGLDCPCLPCYNCHDCGYWKSNGINQYWVVSFDCATRYNKGCPDYLRRPHHLFKFTKRFSNRKIGDIFRCVRCGQKVKIGECKFDFSVIKK